MLNAGVEMAVPKSSQTLGCSHPATAPANCNPPSSPPHCPGDPVVSAEHLGELQQASSTSKSGSSDQNQKRHHLPHLVCSPEALSESQPAVLGTELHPARLACVCHDVMAIILFSCLCFSPWSPLFFFLSLPGSSPLPTLLLHGIALPPSHRRGRTCCTHWLLGVRNGLTLSPRVTPLWRITSLRKQAPACTLVHTHLMQTDPPAREQAAAQEGAPQARR